MVANVYWVGSDGNVWFRDPSGTRNMGKPLATSMQGFDTALGSAQAQSIADPNPSGPGSILGATAPPNGGGATAPMLNQAGVSNTQRTIDEIPGLLEAALAAEKTRYGNTTREFDEQETGQRKTYDNSTVTNQQNYDANFMDSIRSGIKGLGGLMSLLRGTGAGGGTAEDIARDTVGGVTSNDIRAGADTQQENQVALDSSLGNFLTDLGRKRTLNEDTFANNQNAVLELLDDAELRPLYPKD